MSGRNCRWARRSGAALGFALRRQWLMLAVVAIVILVALLLQDCSALGPWSTKESADRVQPFQTLWTRIDPIVTLATLGTALLVWFSEARQDWERSLPVLLTVEFCMGDRIAMRCERAPLIEDSPRAWGQQVGRQMNQNANLDLSPQLFPKPAQIERWRGAWVKHLVVRFELRQWPEHVPPENAPLVWNQDNGFGQMAPPENGAAAESQ